MNKKKYYLTHKSEPIYISNPIKNWFYLIINFYLPFIWIMAANASLNIFGQKSEGKNSQTIANMFSIISND